MHNQGKTDSTTNVFGETDVFDDQLEIAMQLSTQAASEESSRRIKEEEELRIALELSLKEK